MNKLSLTLLSIAGVALLIALTMFAFIQHVSANPSSYSPRCILNSATATTTKTTMTTGAATTTIACDMGGGAGFAADFGTLLLDRLASSTGSVTNIRFEFSAGAAGGADCTTSQGLCTWYADGSIIQASTSAPVNFQTGNNATAWKFASSSIGTGVDTADLTHDSLALPFLVRARYVRAILTVPASASSSMIYGEIVGRKQVQ